MILFSVFFLSLVTHKIRQVGGARCLYFVVQFGGVGLVGCGNCQLSTFFAKNNNDGQAL